MQSAVQPFFTNDFEGWVKVIGGLGALSIFVWGMLKGKIQQDINGVGERVKKLEGAHDRTQSTMGELRDRVLEGSQDRANMRETIGEMRRAQEVVTQAIRDMQDDVVSEIQRTRDVVNQEHMKMRERVVRLETVNEIEQLLGRKISEVARDS